MSRLTSASVLGRTEFPHRGGGGEAGKAHDEESVGNEYYVESLDAKQDDIFCCLHGVEENVDLWQLRDFALSRGGLVNSSIRKRAWPKLVGAHEKIWKSSEKANTQDLVNVSSSSMQLLADDVTRSVWAVEEHVNMARQQEELRLSKLRTRKVSFVPDLTESKSGESDGPSPVKSIGFSNDLPHDGDNSTVDGSVGTFSPMTVVTCVTGDVSLIKTMPKRNASKSEQKLIFNIVVSVLRIAPEDSPHFEDDRYKYCRGLADLAALMLINLESPSLTSLVLGQLAQRHLRDAMRNTTASVEAAIRISFYPLLKKVDHELYSHVSRCLEIPSFCMPWVQGWFCQQLTDVRVASRLMDVFLVSHALMPM